MQIKRDFAGSTDMWPTSAGGQLIEVANLTGFTVYGCLKNAFRCFFFHHNLKKCMVKAARKKEIQSVSYVPIHQPITSI
jgi:hypothetical protein